MELVKKISKFLLFFSFFVGSLTFAKDKIYTYKANISCDHCVNTIKKSLEKKRKIKKYTFSIPKKEVYVVFENGKPLTKEEIEFISSDSEYPLSEVKK